MLFTAGYLDMIYKLKADCKFGIYFALSGGLLMQFISSTSDRPSSKLFCSVVSYLTRYPSYADEIYNFDGTVQPNRPLLLQNPSFK